MRISLSAAGWDGRRTGAAWRERPAVSTRRTQRLAPRAHQAHQARRAVAWGGRPTKGGFACTTSSHEERFGRRPAGHLGGGRGGRGRGSGSGGAGRTPGAIWPEGDVGGGGEGGGGWRRSAGASGEAVEHQGNVGTLGATRTYGAARKSTGRRAPCGSAPSAPGRAHAGAGVAAMRRFCHRLQPLPQGEGAWGP